VLGGSLARPQNSLFHVRKMNQPAKEDKALGALFKNRESLKQLSKTPMPFKLRHDTNVSQLQSLTVLQCNRDHNNTHLGAANLNKNSRLDITQ
jgi:hypothetical protein